MFSWIKKHFIPHEGNENRPHILRNVGARNIVAIVLFLEIFTFLIPILTRINVTGGMATVLPAVLSLLTNNERQAQNLKTLTVNPILNKAAEMKAEDMATKGYFSHTSPEGKTPWYWIEQVGYSYQYAGENLAINFSDSKDVTTAWMASPAHKANIVKGNYTEIGTGVATGLYKGRETIFVAQVYANPLPKVAVQPIKKSSSTAKGGDVQKTTVKETPKVATTIKEPDNVLGAEVAPDKADSFTYPTTTTQTLTFWQKLIASPRNTMNIILFIIFGLMAFALLLYTIIIARQYHLDLITNGLIVLAIIGAIFVANYYWSTSRMVILDSFDYSVGNK